MEKHCKKTCRVKEFKTKVTDKTAGFSSRKKFSFDYRFLQQKGIDDLRFKELFKTVKTEYLIMTFQTLIGNVGSALGMFLGFSFIGAYEWFLTDGSKLMASLKRK